MKLLDTLRKVISHDEGCVACPEKDAQIARLHELLRSKAVRTYPIISPNQVRLADEIAYADKDRPWRTVRGTVISCGWTATGSFTMTLAVGWSWSDQIAPDAGHPRGYYSMHTGSVDVEVEIPSDKKLRLLYRLDLT